MDEGKETGGSAANEKATQELLLQSKGLQHKVDSVTWMPFDGCAAAGLHAEQNVIADAEPSQNLGTSAHPSAKPHARAEGMH